jgi:rubredoxin
MPWRCPACSNIIRLKESERTPRAKARYRCHVCRLGLEYQPTGNKMIVVRSDDDGEAPRQKRSRSR